MAATVQPAPPPAADGSSGAEWGIHADWLWRGERCHWRVLGEENAPALLLVHGFAAGSGHWRRNAAVLAAAGWRVYGIDLIGFGASSQPCLRLDNRLWARQLSRAGGAGASRAGRPFPRRPGGPQLCRVFSPAGASRRGSPPTRPNLAAGGQQQPTPPAALATPAAALARDPALPASAPGATGAPDCPLAPVGLRHPVGLQRSSDRRQGPAPADCQASPAAWSRSSTM